jgi:hypothetical protein
MEPIGGEATLRKYHSEITDSFVAYDEDNKEFHIREYTHFDDIANGKQKPDKIAVVRYYMTETGEHVQKKDSSHYIVLSGYGSKNINIQKSRKK